MMQNAIEAIKDIYRFYIEQQNVIKNISAFIVSSDL